MLCASALVNSVTAGSVRSSSVSASKWSSQRTADDRSVARSLCARMGALLVMSGGRSRMHADSWPDAGRSATPRASGFEHGGLIVDASPARTVAELVAAIDETHALGMACVRVAPGGRYADAATWREVAETVTRYLDQPHHEPAWHDAPSWTVVTAALGGELVGMHVTPTADLQTGHCPGNSRLEVGW